MGWSSGTEIFDVVCEALLTEEPIDDARKKEILAKVIAKLEDMDWDCEYESAYWKHPIVSAIFRERNPEWFEDEDEAAS